MSAKAETDRETAVYVLQVGARSAAESLNVLP